jgi:hypothetical protein
MLMELASSIAVAADLLALPKRIINAENTRVMDCVL